MNRNGTNYIYAAGQVISEYANGAPAGTPNAQYINFGGSQIASIVGGAVTFNYADHLSTRLVTDLSGKPIRTYGHFPAGETLYQTGVASDFQFTSYRRDANSGLDYADARFYSSRLGRFISADPRLGDNRYVYGNGDSINMIDPSGLAAVCIGNACGPNCIIICIGLGDLGGASGPDCALCGESLGLPGGMKIAPQSLGNLLKEALGIPAPCPILASDLCGFTSFVSQQKSGPPNPCTFGQKSVYYQTLGFDLPCTSDISKENLRQVLEDKYGTIAGLLLNECVSGEVNTLKNALDTLYDAAGGAVAGGVDGGVPGAVMGASGALTFTTFKHIAEAALICTERGEYFPGNKDTFPELGGPDQDPD